ncbi:hypothetical protein [Paenibacillus naphthalenovorans]|uniref:hypothetical protein n=1 Tax=Paenibacillus naphthalenovorans TaxID=162209 RepID=UPI003D27F67E
MHKLQELLSFSFAELLERFGLGLCPQRFGLANHTFAFLRQLHPSHAGIRLAAFPVGQTRLFETVHCDIVLERTSR